jgi:2-octaprenyl-6-methoxyphenol hydroxylase
MQRFDVIIMGGGLVGLTLAIGLSRHGVTCAVVDPAEPETTLAAGFDGRVSAIASASWKLFSAIGIAEHRSHLGQRWPEARRTRFRSSRRGRPDGNHV